MPLNRLIFILVTVIALAGGTIALFTTFVGTAGSASLTQIILLALAVAALALGVRYFAPRPRDDQSE
ncbi:hypothetical protein [Yoonia litorea]|uniref:Uncharacterized protein n=1 Tax=Yoonia litorea TaxID=1123755 RepID=A0A1I6M881_9RHOB|nr:hypothetical protein [Yoonia litorea]SFS11924.1 hypothetical protein SAMN05444714_1362 [Yoonia litorea]